MKIINKEKLNGDEFYNEVAYVQINDIILAIKLHRPIPYNLGLQIAGYTEDICEENNVFIRLTNFEDIEFVKAANWILDYKKYRNLDSESIQKELNTIQQSMTNWVLTYYDDETNIDKSVSLLQYKAAQYQYNQIIEAFMLQSKNTFEKFPSAIDSDGFHKTIYSCLLNSNLTINESLNPYAIILSFPKEFDALYYKANRKDMLKIINDYIKEVTLSRKKEMPRICTCEDIIIHFNSDKEKVLVSLIDVYENNQKLQKDQQSPLQRKRQLEQAPVKRTGNMFKRLYGK